MNKMNSIIEMFAADAINAPETVTGGGGKGGGLSKAKSQKSNGSGKAKSGKSAGKGSAKGGGKGNWGACN